LKKKQPITQQEIAAFVAKAEARFNTPEGQQALKEAFERGAAEGERLAKLCYVNWDKVKDLRITI
jgi:hypothetical protein